MFFVGGTGQLLTLILTVCLPFVFLFSAQPKTELLKETLIVEQYEIHQQVTSIEKDTLKIHPETTEKIQSNTNFEEILFKKIHCCDFRVKWKSVYSKSSGNKAPPVFHNLYC